MEILITVIIAVVLTAVVIAVARAGSGRHQEDLNEHGATEVPRAAEDRGRPAEPKTDRPAGPDAEPMGVADAGEPSVDPSAEQRG